MDTILSPGEWLRRRRKAFDLTQDELAARVGCSKELIAKIEQDARRPSKQIAELLAAQLQLSDSERPLLVRALRAEVAVDRLPDPLVSVPRPTLVAADPTLAADAVATPIAPAAMPTGTVSFLFTDIESSTARWEAQPELMRAELARHDAILNQAIASLGGVVFKTVGDAFCAAFMSAPDALAAALAGQRALLAESWGELGPLLVRMAIHTGTAEPQNGDYLGPPLNRVARLLAAGHGSQILIAGGARDLLRDTLCLV